MLKFLIFLTGICFHSEVFSQNKYLLVETNLDMKPGTMEMPFFISLNDSIDFAHLQEALSKNDPSFLSFCNSSEKRIYLVSAFILANSQTNEEYEIIISDLEKAKSTKVLEIKNGECSIKFSVIEAKIETLELTQMDNTPVFYYNEAGISFKIETSNLNCALIKFSM